MNENNLILADDIKIFDKLVEESKKTGPIGWVRMFLQNKIEKEKKLIHEGFNLIVGNGREFIAQKIFNTNTGSSNNWKSFAINAFGVGRGGATIVNDEPVISDPAITDIKLNDAISLGGSYYVSTDGNVVGSVKPIEASGGSIVLVPGDYTEGTFYSKVKCTCIVDAGEPTYLQTGQSVKISEAGLFFTNGNVNKLFSRICFAPKWKEKDSVLTIVWYIIC